MNPVEMFEQTMGEIFGETEPGNYDSWPKILPLVGVDHCWFPDEHEERFAFEWMQEKIKKYGSEYIQNYRESVLTAWENAKHQYRIDRKKVQEKRKKKKEKRRWQFWKKANKQE